MISEDQILSNHSRVHLEINIYQAAKAPSEPYELIMAETAAENSEMYSGREGMS